MLQAMNTGHDGSLSTLHANSPRDALSRIETMALMAGMELPLRAIRDQTASALDLIVHLSRLRDGSRRVTQISEIVGSEGDVVSLSDLFALRLLGRHRRPTGVTSGTLRADRVCGRRSPTASPTSASSCRPVCSASTPTSCSAREHGDERHLDAAGRCGRAVRRAAPARLGARQAAGAPPPPRRPSSASCTRQTTRTRFAALGTQATALAERALDELRPRGSPRSSRSSGPASTCARPSSRRWRARRSSRRRSSGSCSSGPIVGARRRRAHGGRLPPCVSRCGRRSGASASRSSSATRCRCSRAACAPVTACRRRWTRSCTRRSRRRARSSSGCCSRPSSGTRCRSAMRNLADRVGSEDFEWVAEAVEIQRDIGGDLAELLDNVTTRSATGAGSSRQINTLTAEGRLSAVILFCLPIVMFGFMAFANQHVLQHAHELARRQPDARRVPGR